MDGDELDKDLRASLRIQDEDELLQFQEAFMASKQAPSVKVVRRDKAQSASTSASAEAARPSASKPPSRFAQRAAATRSPAAPSSAVSGVLGDVQEKWDIEAPKAPSMPKPGPVPHRAGFPVAAPAARAPPLGRTAPAMAGHAASGPQDERSQIDEENRRRIAGMSQDEIMDAQAEIARLLPPHLLQSLKKGGAR